MTDSVHPSSPRNQTHVGPLPDGLATGSAVLVATATPPARDAVGLQLLARFGADDDEALVVTTTESAAETVETAEAAASGDGRPSLSVVDTVSTQQSVSDRYGDVPVVFTPAPGDLERLVVALSELAEDGRPDEGARHLLVRSVTPIVDAVSTEQVCAALRQVSGTRTESGTTLVGVDFTAHDDETMAALVAQVDGVLWATPDGDGGLALDYRPATGRFDGPRPL